MEDQRKKRAETRETMEQFTELTREQIIEVYETLMPHDFPDNEIKPLNLILNCYDKGYYCAFGILEKGRIQAYALLCRAAEQNALLLDYLAVHSTVRGLGYGSRMIQKLQQHYADSIYPELIIEVESLETAQNEEERFIRERRIHFYEKNGLIVTNVRSVVAEAAFTLLILPLQNSFTEEELTSRYSGIYETMMRKDMFQKYVHIWNSNT